MNLKRSSGVLLHISSLPSPYGIGDLGHSAYQFVDFLHQSGHHYWQILPINPTEASFNHSPYSSFSAFAGNPLLISPDHLLQEGLLSKENLSSIPHFEEDKVNFEKMGSYKLGLLDRAYENFIEKEKMFTTPFTKFCEESIEWLEDYALYLTLKNKYKSYWTKWPKAIRNRDDKTIANLKNELAQGIKKEKIIQYLFFSQWQKLADYCHQKEVYLIGDIPFYINHDSVDCWAHSTNFKLDKNKKPTKISGVPPDYFSETGQLWGTPVYAWDKLKEKGFDWWVARIGQNLKLYDIVRLDHFRAFSAYWEVPATEKTAIKGKWISCPGKDFFQVIQKKFPEMPFIAEDLGLMDDAVYDLLKTFDFPGMKVLQFAFDENIGDNAYILHNHTPNSIVFTGTHDNNTSVGWFNALDSEDIGRLSDYVGQKVTKANVHQILHRLALMSVSALAIVPIQDILGLDEKAIMNRPGTDTGNWTWRMRPKQFPRNKAKALKAMNLLFGRWAEKTEEMD